MVSKLSKLSHGDFTSPVICMILNSVTRNLEIKFAKEWETDKTCGRSSSVFGIETVYSGRQLSVFTGT